MKNEEVDNIDNLDFFPNDGGVSPTDLNLNDIEKFGQESMPFIVDTNKSLNTTMYDNSKKIDEYISIGNTPDGILTERTQKKRFKVSRPIFIILVFLIIFLIGFGIYYFLFSSRKVANNAVKTKDVEISIGEKLSLNLDDYATFKNIKPTNCILNISGVNNLEIGKYEYYISCGVNKYKGNVIVKDNTAPSVVTKFVVLQDAKNINVNDFIVSCDDISECSYSINNKEDLIANGTNIGIYDVELLIKDKDGNSKIVNESLVISNENVKSIMICSNSVVSDEFSGNYYNTDYISFLENGTISLLRKNITAIFDDSETYTNYLSKIDNGNIYMQGINGKAFSYDKEKTISVFEFENIDNNLVGKDEDEVSLEYMFDGYSCKSYDN